MTNETLCAIERASHVPGTLLEVVFIAQLESICDVI